MIIIQILKYLIIFLPFGGGSVVFPWIFLGFLVLGLIFGAMFEGVEQMGSCDPNKVCQHKSTEKYIQNAWKNFRNANFEEIKPWQ